MGGLWGTATPQIMGNTTLCLGTQVLSPFQGCPGQSALPPSLSLSASLPSSTQWSSHLSVSSTSPQNSCANSTLATPWTVVHQAPLSKGFSRQEYCSGLPFPSPRDLPDLGIKPTFPALQADSLLSEPLGKSPWFSDILKIQLLLGRKF